MLPRAFWVYEGKVDHAVNAAIGAPVTRLLAASVQSSRSYVPTYPLLELEWVPCGELAGSVGCAGNAEHFDGFVCHMIEVGN